MVFLLALSRGLGANENRLQNVKLLLVLGFYLHFELTVNRRIQALTTVLQMFCDSRITCFFPHFRSNLQQLVWDMLLYPFGQALSRLAYIRPPTAARKFIYKKTVCSCRFSFVPSTRLYANKKTMSEIYH